MASDETIEDEYPHVLTAITEHSAYINARCAVEYVVWHALHVATLVLLAAIAIVVSPFYLAGVAIGSTRVPDLLARVRDHEYVQLAGLAVLGLCAAAIVLIALVLFVVLAISNPTTFVVVVGAAIALILMGLGVIQLVNWFGDDVASSVSSAAETASNTAASTPGVRRVWGKCPVSFDQEPKWFKKIT